jgi:uncharacterized membrane protein YphA (DoxX/SURF4 family)
MTLLTLCLYIAIAAAILTALIGFLKRELVKNWLMSFLQNFAGTLFIISGLVKAVDPLGTAYKMEQYFAEFAYTFQETALSFIAPVFPFLSSISVVFSVAMIIFEIILGVALLLGSKPKLTSWAFLLLVVFFTMLTGFTFLTGYVPSGVNFFSFSEWGPYTPSNMRVTDCGCFGDFIKLEPKISFFKDLVLLIPSIFFVFRHRDMHQLFTARMRSIVLWAATALLFVFCLRNYYLGLPVVDFRPFKIGNDLYHMKTAEEEAAASVRILSMELKNNHTGEEKSVPYDEYMQNWESYPKEVWTVVDKIMTKPAIEKTKVSDFSVEHPDGYDVAEDILTDEGDVFLIIAHKLKGDSYTEEVMVPDTVWRTDTIVISPDSVLTVQSISQIGTRREVKVNYSWNDQYVKLYTSKVNPLMDAVMSQGAKVYAIGGGAGSEKLAAFRQAIGGTYDWYEADDILLKTIIRSNPGVVHLKAGKVMNKWHIRNLPRHIQLN